ncbi:MAG TPA: helix-turn-helix transcriptional regulator [Solirubrobacterales bacterium]|jgi:transcriptional regulator with XRE-family HTH domain
MADPRHHTTRGGSLAAEMLRCSGLTQAELARRAGIPRSVLNAYLRGGRVPGTDALAKLAAAAGFDLSLVPRRPPVDAERAGEILVQVLDLAAALPYRPRAEMETPPLFRRLAERPA